MLDIVIESENSSKFAVIGDCDCDKCSQISPKIKEILRTGNIPNFSIATPISEFGWEFLDGFSSFLKYMGIGVVALASAQAFSGHFNPYTFFPMIIFVIASLFIRINLDKSLDNIKHYQDHVVEYLDLPKDLKTVWKKARKEYKKNIELNPNSKIYDSYMEEIRNDIIALMEYYPKAVKKNIMDVYHSRLHNIDRKVQKMSELTDGSNHMKMIEAKAKESGFLVESSVTLENEYDLR